MFDKPGLPEEELQVGRLAELHLDDLQTEAGEGEAELSTSSLGRHVLIVIQLPELLQPAGGGVQL